MGNAFKRRAEEIKEIRSNVWGNTLVKLSGLIGIHRTAHVEFKTEKYTMQRARVLTAR